MTAPLIKLSRWLSNSSLPCTRRRRRPTFQSKAVFDVRRNFLKNSDVEVGCYACLNGEPALFAKLPQYAFLYMLVIVP